MFAMLCLICKKEFISLKVLFSAVFFAMLNIANAQADWPQPVLPGHVSVFAVGDQLTANGLPMRVQGFVSTEDSVEDLLAWFRRYWGQPLMENTVGAKRILGRLQNGFYWTVQIEAVRRGAKGLVAVTDLSARAQASDRYVATTERLLARFPAGSQLVSHMVSPGEGKTASHVVVSNRHSESLNHDALKAMLADEGMALERETSVLEQSDLRGKAIKTLYFKGASKEAMAVISSDSQGRSTVILNTVITMEHFKK